MQNSSNLAPIVLFVYNRLDHTRQTVEALSRNQLAEKSELYIFSDGPKNEQAKVKVNQVREYIKDIKGFKSVNITEREINLGLANSVITGVTDIVNKYGNVIVLEDDIVTSSDFLLYMNKALCFYENEKKVFSITGYSITTNSKNNILEDNYFIKTAECWSWATWADRWRYFDSEAKGWNELSSNIKLRYKFNFNNAYDYYGMLKQQMNNGINSWAIRWYWSVFNKSGLTLHPRKTIVQNIGLDGTGIHCGETEIKGNVLSEYKASLNFPSEIYEKPEIRAEVIRIMKEDNRNILRKVASKIKRTIKFILK